MNVIKFSSSNPDIVFCLVDNTQAIPNLWNKEIVKNIADYTISNLHKKGYTIFQGTDTNELLEYAAADYKFAVVFSTGTEFVNGTAFFDQLDDLITRDFLVCGHVLDRGDAYYELHHQCFVVNLDYYKSLGSPAIGDQELGCKHVQRMPFRSEENYHDDYTPVWIKPGHHVNEEYQHKCHGWNFIATALAADIPVLVFDDIRDSKRHHYPESTKDFNKCVQWLHHRHQFCSNTFVHTDNTEIAEQHVTSKFQQVVVPASGTLYLNLVEPGGTIIMYDYNQSALDYWQKHAPRISDITYKFVKLDLLGEEIKVAELLANVSTFINLSNIFCYEGTAAFCSLQYRLFKEQQLMDNIKTYLPNAIINISVSASEGFGDGRLLKPTWHYNLDWVNNQ